MILIDSDIFMYAAGAEHPHKKPSLTFLERVARGDIEAAVDAEVLQEILHRFRTINRWRDGRHVYDLARRIVEVVGAARALLDGDDRLIARDALHVAVASLHAADAICSYDRDFDGIEGIRRIEPPA